MKKENGFLRKSSIIIISIILFAVSGSSSFASPAMSSHEYYPTLHVRPDYKTFFNYSIPPRLNRDFLLSLNNSNKVKQSPNESSGDRMILAHTILGYGSVIFAVASLITGIAAPDKGGHTISAYGTAAIGSGAVITGLLAYSDVLSFDDGLNSYNIHATMGIVSALVWVTSAVLGGIGVKHCGPGIASGVTLTVSIAVLYF